MKGCEHKKSDGWGSEFMAWVDKHCEAILAGVISGLVVALIFIRVDGILDDKALAARMDIAEAGAAEGRRAAAEFRREARQQWRKAAARAAERRKEAEARAAEDRNEAEDRAAEDRREANRYFRQINELLLGMSKRGVESSVRLDHIEGLRTQEE